VLDGLEQQKEELCPLLRIALGPIKYILGLQDAQEFLLVEQFSHVLKEPQIDYKNFRMLFSPPRNVN
jgi:hypothetical protein